MRRFLSLLCFSCFMVVLNVTAQTDSLLVPNELPEITVDATEARESIITKYNYIPYQSVEEKSIKRFGASDLTPSMNRIPGVRFEQRTPGSYRVSIRNTARRSPFGVRDVQVYWNGIPLTEPGGDTPLNFVDIANIDFAAAIKGPSSIEAGSPLGGVIKLGTLIPVSNQVALQLGSFGQKAGSFRYSIGDSGATQVQVRLTHRSTDGHRSWTNFRRSTAQLSIYTPQKKTPNKWSIQTRTDLLATRLDYNLPGALTPTQYAENPYQARPGSEESKASIDYENVLLGTRVHATKNDWDLIGTTYLTGFRFDNPFNVNHKRETNVGVGAKAFSRYTFPKLKKNNFRYINLGGEAQFQFREARQYDPNQGIPGDLQFSDDIQSRRLLLFSEYYQDIGYQKNKYTDWHYRIGISAVHVQYDVDRSFDRGGSPSQTQSSLDLTVSPRLLLMHKSPKHNLCLSYSYGSSTPSLREFRTNEGSLNQSLRPEIGNSLELYGFYNFSRAFRLSANAYLTQLKQTITTYQDTSGIQLFRNAGRTTQPGVEFAFDWQLTKAINVAPAYSYQPYTYDEYEVNGTSFAGRPMPGLPTHTLDVLVHGDFAKRFYTDFNVRYESENPLDDAGDVVADAFVILRLQVGARFKGYHAFIAGDNLLDEIYSLGNDINPQFGNRYFQAAPPRNINVGLSLDFGEK